MLSLVTQHLCEMERVLGVGQSIRVTVTLDQNRCLSIVPDDWYRVDETTLPLDG